MINVYNSVASPPESLLPVNIKFADIVITRQDLLNGEITRYFCRPVNQSDSSGIIEVDKQTYQQIKSNRLYSSVEMRWIIKGNVEDSLTNSGSLTRLQPGVKTTNKLLVKIADEQMSGLQTVITNYLKFWQGE